MTAEFVDNNKKNTQFALYGSNHVKAIFAYFIAWIKATIVKFGF